MLSSLLVFANMVPLKSVEGDQTNTKKSSNKFFAGASVGAVVTAAAAASAYYIKTYYLKSKDDAKNNIVTDTKNIVTFDKKDIDEIVKLEKELKLTPQEQSNLAKKFKSLLGSNQEKTNKIKEQIKQSSYMKKMNLIKKEVQNAIYKEALNNKELFEKLIKEENPTKSADEFRKMLQETVNKK